MSVPCDCFNCRLFSLVQEELLLQKEFTKPELEMHQEGVRLALFQAMQDVGGITVTYTSSKEFSHVVN